MQERTNIRIERTSFHGRERLLGLIEDLVGRGRRVITVLGPPGVGKTRLAERFAERVSTTEPEAYPGGSWRVDLTDTQSATELLTSTARSLAIPISIDQSGEAAETERIGWAIADRGASLIIFDGFEHLVASCREILDQWLSQARKAVFLVTSRHRLHLADEVLVEVGPMELPRPGEEDASVLRAIESVALFTDRGRLVRPSWEPSGDELRLIGEIVRRLDGLPLAIELAAARMDVLSPSQIARRLDRRFRLLGSSPSETGRRSSLTASLQWSWDHLEVWERATLRQLTVFRGGFTAPSVEAIVDVAGIDGSPGVLDILHRLKAKSLVSTGGADGRSDALRFRLLESIREYAASRFEDEDEARGALERHATHFALKGGEWARAIIFTGDPKAAGRIAEERGNLQAVFSRCVAAGTDVASARGAAETGADSAVAISHAQLLSLVLALAPIFHPSVPLSTYEGLVASIRDHLAGEQEGSASELALVRYAIGEVYRLLERLDDAEAMFRRAQKAAERSGEARLQGLALLGIARIFWERMSCDESVDATERALAHLEEGQEPALVVAALRNLAMADSNRWNAGEAIPLWERALSAARRWRVLNEELRILIFLGRDLWMCKRFRRLDECAERARRVSETLGDAWLEANRLMSFAYLQAEPGRDGADLLEALRYFKGFGSHLSATSCSLASGFFWLDKGRRELARTYLERARDRMTRFDPPIWLKAEGLSLEAVIHWDGGDLETASRKLETAIGASRKSGHVIFEVVWLSQLAAVKTRLRRPSEAVPLYEAAGAILETYDLPMLDDLHALLRAFWDVHLAEEAQRRRDDGRAAQHRARARRRLATILGPWAADSAMPWHPESSAYYSPDIRLAARKLECALDPADQRQVVLHRLDPRREALIVDREGRWFLVPDREANEVVDLSSRSKLCRLLSTLANAWRPQSPDATAPPTMLTREDIAEAVWPGEKLIPRSLRARVQVAISTLRKMGLRDYLLRRGQTYLLDPAKPVKVLSVDIPAGPHLQHHD